MTQAEVNGGPNAKSQRALSPTVHFCPGYNMQMAVKRLCEACE
jgi:hypothetical protein